MFHVSHLKYIVLSKEPYKIVHFIQGNKEKGSYMYTVYRGEGIDLTYDQNVVLLS